MRERLSGWGRVTPAYSDVVTVTAAAEVAAVLAGGRAAHPRGVLPRGLGRSYGDSAQNAGGDVVAMRGLHAIDTSRLAVDGMIRVQSGASLDDVMRRCVPLGWFVPVTTGTRHVTIGGAVAADIHGKNHHGGGSLARHVSELTLATPTGARVLHPGDPLFDATFGGMGLTGIVVEAVIRMEPISSSRVLVDTDRAADLEALLALMSEGDDAYPFSVAWIDCLARGRQMGRGVLERGRFANADELPAKLRSDPLAFGPAERFGTPQNMPVGLLNPLTVRTFNELWFRKAPLHRREHVSDIGPFFHPLDGVRGWNALYGPRGFVEYQTVVPFGAEDVLRLIVEQMSTHPAPAAVSVLKRFGAAAPGHLSFPMPGWTLSVDIPAATPGLGPLLDTFDEAVVAAGGRAYLPKDSRMRPALLPAMYTRLDEWRAIRDEADPERVLTSDQARRLGIVDGAAADPRDAATRLREKLTA